MILSSEFPLIATMEKERVTIEIHAQYVQVT